MNRLNKERALRGFERQFLHFATLHPRIEVNLSASDLMGLIATVQLALRHPEFSGPTAERMREMVDGLIARIEAVHPPLAALLRLGDNPEYDTPA